MIGYVIAAILLSLLFGALAAHHYKEEAKNLKKQIRESEEETQKKVDKLNKEILQLKEVNDFLRRSKKRR